MHRITSVHGIQRNTQFERAVFRTMCLFLLQIPSSIDPEEIGRDRKRSEEIRHILSIYD